MSRFRCSRILRSRTGYSFYLKLLDLYFQSVFFPYRVTKKRNNKAQFLNRLLHRIFFVIYTDKGTKSYECVASTMIETENWIRVFIRPLCLNFLNQLQIHWIPRLLQKYTVRNHSIIYN